MNMYAEITAAAYLEFMIHEFYNGLVTLLELEALNDDELETVYALGYNFFTFGKYEAAKDIFTGLTVCAPEKDYYWRALGAVNQQLKQYSEAIAAYDMAVEKNQMDVVSYVYRGESHILSSNVEAGLECLKTAAEIGAEDPQFSAWVQRARFLIDLHEH
jgi:type III secretion system low calcium response chaperone LcrH/SycD